MCSFAHDDDEPRIRTRHAEHSDLSGIVECHLAAFPGSFMSLMGNRWLKGLYGYYIDHDRGISIVALDEKGTVLGFSVGGDSNIRDQFINRALIRYLHVIAIRFFSSSVCRRTLLSRAGVVLKKLFGTGRTQVVGPPRTTDDNIGDLLSIGVRPACAGRGVAGKLIQAFETAGMDRGYKTLELCVESTNARAIAFYRKHSWQDVYSSKDDTWFRWTPRNHQ